MKIVKLSLLSLVLSTLAFGGFVTYSVTEGAAPAVACDAATDPLCG